tara:strand:+ start:505 stop:702 length:198 start_codon:yes stop_codon:yes gene_type:complete
VFDVETVPQVPVSHSNDVARRKRKRRKEKMKQKKENNEVDQYGFCKVMSLYDRYIKGKQSLFFTY